MENDNPPNELYVIEESDAFGIGSGSWGISKHPGGGLRVADDPGEADSLRFKDLSRFKRCTKHTVSGTNETWGANPIEVHGFIRGSSHENKQFRCVKYVSA